MVGYIYFGGICKGDEKTGEPGNRCSRGLCGGLCAVATAVAPEPEIRGGDPVNRFSGSHERIVKREVRLVPKKTSTFHDWPYFGPQRKCFHAWIVNLTPPGPDHCIHDCVYCYARYAVYTRVKRGAGGAIVRGPLEVYSNLPELIERDLDRIRLCPPFSISNTTDPCQAVPAVCRETRRIVDLLVRRGPSFSITTKGDPSFLLDVDGFTAHPRKFLAVTIEGPPDVLGLLSPGAPSYEKRLEAVRTMADAKTPVIVRLDPVMLHLWRALYGEDWRGRLSAIMRDFGDAGAIHVVASTGRLSKGAPLPSMFSRLRGIVELISPVEAARMEADYEYSREYTSEGYLLRKPLRMDFHRLARAEAEKRGMTYATCQETAASETDTPGIPHCEGVGLPFTLKGTDGVFRPVEGCAANCHVECRGKSPACGRKTLVTDAPLRLAALR
jgi:DNA repair photolyase